MNTKSTITIPELSTDIHSLNHEGLGIATVNNKTTFIEGALPLETVKYRLIKKRRHYDEATCIEIVNPSPERTTPSCMQFGICGGCSMQHLDIFAQIAWKQKILLEQLERLGHVKPDNILPPLFSSSWGYRHKARLGARYVEKQGKVFVGFRKKYRSQIADIDLCHVLHPSIGKHLPLLSELISNLESRKDIPQIEVAIGDDNTALIFRHLTPLSNNDVTQLCHFGKQHQIHIYLQPNPPQAISLLWPNDTKHRLCYQLPDFHLEMLFHPLDFTQIHLDINRLMVKQAVSLLDPQPNENVLDLFCGIGNFTLPLTRYARKVTGVEGSQLMIERGYENAKHNAISNVEFYTANLFEIPTKGSWFHSTYDKILLDPPRTGAKEIIEYFSKWNAKRIVYVSCNPATLARDADLLVHRYGYRMKHAGMINMFPHTSHVEAMTVFE